jgi:hypothetical protein
VIELRNHITRNMLKEEPNTLFVFGDNFEREGFGGQAKEMRGEPNAVGIITKRSPSMDSSAFLKDADIYEWYAANAESVLRLKKHTAMIVWPLHGIGTGLAKLKEHAPRIADEIEFLKKYLFDGQRRPG